MAFETGRYQEADLAPLSSLQHYLFCPRQCALIHLEQIWTENLFTAEGRVLHERAHSEKQETCGHVKRVTGLRLRSLRLGVSGQADVVEFHSQGKEWRPFPVEYKRGRPKKTDADLVQLCAQAMCLEEMLNIPVTEGAIYYGKSKRRLAVAITEELRNETITAALAVHELLDSGQTPAPIFAECCHACSLITACMPDNVQSVQAASSYVERLKNEI
jgi:CRISPR-associated exonuclease Cas4